MSNLSFNIKNMLWSTRGNEWGFRYVHRPEAYPDLSEQIYKSIFIKDDRVPLRWYGTVSLPNGAEINFVASRFFDPETIWKDIAGRQIPQEMYLDIGIMPPEDLTCCFWEYAVMNQVRDYYSDAYNKSSESIQPFEAPTEALMLPFMPCSIGASRVYIQLSSQISDKQSSKINQNNASIRGRVWKVLNTDLNKLLPK